MPSREHAVVIGGSMAGLVAARVLADHFESVTVLERDRFPEGPEPRKGVPQGKHPHVLLVRGARILEEMFPGLRDEMLAAGALSVDWGQDLAWLSPAGWWPRMRSELISYISSRPLLEWHVRRRLAAHPRVRFCEEHDVTGLLPGKSSAEVAGVRLRLRGAAAAAGAQGQELAADLVVDASGRSSRAPDWLAELGYARPEEEVINAFVGYGTCVFRPQADFARDWKAMVVAPRAPSLTRAGLMIEVEDGLWMVTLTGIGRDYPPTDMDGYLAYAATLASPAVYEALQHAEPLTPIMAYQSTENRWRHYEKLDRWPERFVILGDAASAFNPVYGQGITAAALEAELLGTYLSDRERRASGDLGGLAARFQRELAKLIGTIWVMASAEDFRFPATEGPRPPASTRFAHRYLDSLGVLVTQDPEYRLLLSNVLQFVAPASTLYRPKVALRVMGEMLRGRKAA